MGLARYQQKRNFARTPEPGGKVTRRRSRAPTFVVQKHAARRLHYDFRLELEGVFKSWAVPKGFPSRRGERRLAVQVEDHPLDYGGFEGTIPAGNYGAGTVMVWDRGHYELLDDDPAGALRRGKLHLKLHGRKLRGEWTLVRLRGREEAGKTPWLILKTGSDATPVSASADNKSVLTGRTMEQIANEGGRVQQSNRRKAGRSAGTRESKHRAATAKPAGPAVAPVPGDLKRALQKLPRAEPAFVPPMNALLVERPPAGPEWVYEIKWDGYRALAVKRRGQVQLFSRRGREITSDFPDIAAAVQRLPGDDFVADGEIVALDERGRAVFQLLQNYKRKLQTGEAQVVCYYLFDLLNLEGRDLKGLPLASRKRLLEHLIGRAGDPIRFSASLSGDPAQLLAEAKKQQLEGLIAKRLDSVYEPGARSGAWQKLKTGYVQEFVIGGYTAPQGTRPYFGALLVGVYEGGKLQFVSKVGTGFDHETLRSLYARFQKLRTNRVPFANLPTRGAGKYGQGLTRADMRRCTWLRPKLVAQIRFSEWTRDGRLRQPVFLGLRDDKDPREVVRERPVA